jgi:ParB family chromosome partitioning protein
MTHDLKCEEEEFDKTVEGVKTFEFRLNDRDFKVNDVLRLHKIDKNKIYTGNIFNCKVMYILYGPKFGVPDKYCVMAHYGGFLLSTNPMLYK